MEKTIILLITAFCSLSAVAQTVPSYVPTNGLVSWWPFNGNANDESGNGNNGTVNGATLTTDRNGNSNSAYYFSSSSCATRIDVNVNTTSIQSGLTISIWVMKAGNGCIGPRFLEFWPGSDGPGISQWGWDNSNAAAFGCITSTGAIITSSFTAVSINTWTHLVYTNDGLFGRFYQDGVLINTIASSGNPILSGNAAFGRMNHPANDAFNGKLDDIGLWNRALSSCEVHQLYTASLNTFTVNAISSTSVICSGQSATLTASGANSYTWQPANVLNSSNIVTPITNSLYTVSATNSVGCISSRTISIIVNTTPTISANSGTICSGSSFSIIPSGASTYTYSSGSAIVSPTANASYNVLGTDVNGCVSSVAAISNVTVNSLPTVNVNSGAICAGQSFTMVPSGASTYNYSSGSAIVSPTANASYNVLGTDVNGCTSSAAAISNVTVNVLPTVNVNSGAICAGQSFTMVPSGASTYTYSGGSAIVSPTANTSYNVFGTDGNGCVSSVAAISNVTVNALPSVSVNSGAICAGQSFTMLPSGASTYTYSSGSAIVSPTANASYNVLGTDGNGCTSSASAISNVTVNALPSVNVNSGAICAGQSFTMVPSGASTYTYSSGSAIVSPTANASYNVFGTDVNGCTSSAVAISNVTVNALPTVNVNSGAICAGQSFTMLSSGASTYTYSSGSAIVSPTANASYNVLGTDVNGCTSSAAAISNLTVNALPTVSVVSNNKSLCIGQSATLTATGANSYTWNPGSQTSSNVVVSPTITTNYTVVGTNTLTGCSNQTILTQSVSSCAGIENLLSNNNLTIIYPNPTNGLITIEINSNSKVYITNALGKLIFNETIDAGKNHINIQNQSSGIYFVQIIDIQNNTVENIKIMLR